MKRGTMLMVSYFLTLLAGQALADHPAPGKQVACQLKVRTGQTDLGREVTMRYWLYLPAGYDQEKSWPLMIFLHGAGERGDDLELVKTWGPPKKVAGGEDFPFVLVSPQCPREVMWDTDQVAQLTDHIANSLKIDRRRMYITGLSMGGFGTWGMLARFPQLFAAAVPICGGGNPTHAPRMTKVPIWAFHGGDDHVVPVKSSQRMVETVNAWGGNAKLTVYPGVGHNSWSQTYANPQVYKWLLSHKRAE